MASYGATSLMTLLQYRWWRMGCRHRLPDLRILPFHEPIPQRTICLA
jgi:hypothetical protein